MQRYALGEGRFTVLYDFTNEKLARSPVNKGGVIGCYFFVIGVEIQSNSYDWWRGRRKSNREPL